MQSFRNGSLSGVFLDTRVDALGLERLLEGINSIMDLPGHLFELGDSDVVIFLGLLVVELELRVFSLLFDLLVLLPVIDSLLLPLLHETGVSLELVDLNAPHFLFTQGVGLLFLVLQALGHTLLVQSFLVELLHVSLHVEHLLGLVEDLKALLEEGVLHIVVLLFGHGDFLSGLVVAELASLGQHGDVSGRVDLLKDHLELVEQAQGNASLLLHDFIDAL